MSSRLSESLTTLERRMRRSFGSDVSTPWQRFLTRIHFHLFDHAFLRWGWTNFYKVAEGAYRSNQPGRGRLKRYANRGIKTVLNLRGPSPYGQYIFEVEACRDYGMTLVDRPIYARRLATREEYLALIEAFRTIERPFVMHCKSGADRAGLASALYLLTIEGRPIEEARKQLSLKYIHVKNDRTGILDHFLATYAERNSESPISMEDWIATEYDREAITESYKRRKRRLF